MPSCLCFPCLVSESFQSQFLDYIPFILLSRGIPLPWIFLQVKLFTFWGGESHEEETLAIPLLIILESLILIIEIRLLLPPSLLLLSKFDQFSNMKFILIQSHPNKWSLIIHSVSPISLPAVSFVLRHLASASKTYLASTTWRRFPAALVPRRRSRPAALDFRRWFCQFVSFPPSEDFSSLLPPRVFFTMAGATAYRDIEKEIVKAEKKIRRQYGDGISATYISRPVGVTRQNTRMKTSKDVNFLANRK